MPRQKFEKFRGRKPLVLPVSGCWKLSFDGTGWPENLPGTCSRWRSFVSRQFGWRTTWQAECWRVEGLGIRLESGCGMMWLLFKSPLVWSGNFNGQTAMWKVNMKDQSTLNNCSGQTFFHFLSSCFLSQRFPLRPSKSKGWKSKKHQQIGYSRCRIWSDLATWKVELSQLANFESWNSPRWEMWKAKWPYIYPALK